MILDKLAYIWNPLKRKWKPRDRKGRPIFDYWQRKTEKKITDRILKERFLAGQNPNKRFAVKTGSTLDMTGSTS